MVLWWGQGGSALVHLLGLIVPEPLFTGLEAPDQPVPGRVGMRGGMLRWRIVTAADMPALGAPAQVKPPAAGRLALHAAGSARRDRRINAFHYGYLALPASRPRRAGPRDPLVVCL